MKNKGKIIITIIVAYIVICIGIFSIKTEKFIEYSRGTLISVTKDSGGRNIVKVETEDIGVQYGESTDSFLRKSGVKDLEPGDEVIFGSYSTYHRTGIVFSLIWTVVNFVDFNGNHDKHFVIPFSKQVWEQKLTVVSPDSNLLK